MFYYDFLLYIVLYVTIIFIVLYVIMLSFCNYFLLASFSGVFFFCFCVLNDNIWVRLCYNTKSVYLYSICATVNFLTRSSLLT